MRTSLSTPRCQIALQYYFIDRVEPKINIYSIILFDYFNVLLPTVVYKLKLVTLALIPEQTMKICRTLLPPLSRKLSSMSSRLRYSNMSISLLVSYTRQLPNLKPT